MGKGLRTSNLPILLKILCVLCDFLLTGSRILLNLQTMKVPSVKHDVKVVTRDQGKGSSPRPFSISQEEFSDNWDLAFGKRKPNPGHTHIGADGVEHKNKNTNSN